MVWASSISAFVNKTITGTVHKKEKVKFRGLSLVYTPLPVPHSLKKFNSALVIGLASSLIGMQYLIQDVFRSTLMLPLSHLPNHMQMISDVFVG